MAGLAHHFYIAEERVRLTRALWPNLGRCMCYAQERVETAAALAYPVLGWQLVLHHSGTQDHIVRASVKKIHAPEQQRVHGKRRKPITSCAS